MKVIDTSDMEMEKLSPITMPITCSSCNQEVKVNYELEDGGIMFSCNCSVISRNYLFDFEEEYLKNKSKVIP